MKKDRFPIVLLALLCLLTGLYSGLSRIGWTIPSLPITAHHGAIMVSGFLGTLIAFEKVIPLKKKILYLIPILNAVSIAFFFTGHPAVSIYIMVVSSTSLAFVFIYYFVKHRSIIYFMMVIGAFCWVIGNALLLSRLFYPLAFPWWAAFAVFIIGAERLELMKFLPVSDFSKKLFIVLLFSFIVGILLPFHGAGSVICGMALIGVSSWLLRNDIIGINFRKTGLPKFVATSLLCGYVSLMLSGVFYISLSDQWLTYDAIVHSFFLGFAFSMIFAHGPIILPGVLGISATPFSKVLYVWLITLHTSWLVRVYGDIASQMELRKISGLLSAIAIIGYFITMAVITIRRQTHVKAV